MRQRGIVHPDLLAALGDFYPSRCTIRTAVVTQDSYGQEVEAPVDLEGHVDLFCRVAPLQSSEQRSLQQVYALATHTVALAGYYPAITATMAAVIDGVTYQVEGPPQHDGNHITTRFYARQVH